MPAPAVTAPANLSLSAEERAEFESAMKARDYTRAETVLLDAIKANPSSAELLKLAAGVFFLDKNYLNAAIAFAKADRLQPLDEASRFTLAMAYVVLGRRDWARPELEKLAAANPQETRYIYWLARLDYDDQKFAAAVQNLRKAIAIQPDFMKAHDNLALCQEALGQYEEAERAWQEANRLNRTQRPSSAWPPLNFGIMLLKLGKLEAAETHLREALQYDAKFAEAHYRLGMLLEKQGKTVEAIEELSQAASLDLDYPEPQYALARLYRQTGENEKAQAALREFQKRKAARREEGKRE
jgi:tetratricopeptide (TPR) repeat protein